MKRNNMISSYTYYVFYLSSRGDKLIRVNGCSFDFCSAVGEGLGRLEWIHLHRLCQKTPQLLPRQENQLSSANPVAFS
jgi:hypothetical protein